MRYSLIREMDISNGEGVGISLFVQGCHFHCKGCFNQETWNFDGGKPWNDEAKRNFLQLAGRSYVKRISILGGEPLAQENILEVSCLVTILKHLYPDKKIWVYTGYNFEAGLIDRPGIEIEKKFLLDNVDVVCDGAFQLENQDINNKKVKWVGSTNQRVIDVKKTIQNKRITLLGES